MSKTTFFHFDGGWRKFGRGLFHTTKHASCLTHLEAACKISRRGFEPFWRKRHTCTDVCKTANRVLSSLSVYQFIIVLLVLSITFAHNYCSIRQYIFIFFQHLPGIILDYIFIFEYRYTKGMYTRQLEEVLQFQVLFKYKNILIFLILLYCI